MILNRLYRAVCVPVFFAACGVAHSGAQTPLSFVAVTPCRVVDTRWPPSALGGPTLAAGSTRSFPIPASACNIPANAAAYSLNITGVPLPPSGIGYLTVWPTGQSLPIAATLLDPLDEAISNGALVPAGTNGAINIFTTTTANIVIDLNGYFLAQTSGTESTALGTGASNAGSNNTAIGFNSLEVNSGNANTAIGTLALSSNTSGNNNAALGSGALQFNATGGADTAIGSQSLLNNLIGSSNVAIGFNALFGNAVGSNNTALGDAALSANSSGSWNIAVGSQAGQAVTGSYNIDIGNSGQASDSNAIRIGTPSNQTAAYIAGIYNVNVGGGSSVLVNSNGQLGTIQSSRRFKEDIQDMGAASDLLMRLRPVTFRYKQALPGGSRPLQYGLIGEEVEKIFPDLVIYGADGQVDSIAYQELPSLLLNELQKENRTIQRQSRYIADQEERMHLLEKRISALEKVSGER